jgi:glycosyltransferase involved in cell wall biosynthesis
MAETLLHYLDDNTLRDRHGAAARRRVEKNFSIHGMVNRYLEVYDELCHQQDKTRYPVQQG